MRFSSLSSSITRQVWCLFFFFFVAALVIPMFSSSAQNSLINQGEPAKPLASSSNPSADLKQEEFVPGELLVRFRKGSSAVARSSMSLVAGPRVIPLSIERLTAGAEIVEGLRLVRVAATDTLLALEVLNKRLDVLYAEPNFLRFKEALPNDPRFGEQWALKNLGTAGADIHAEQAWDITQGSRSIVVGVVDQGVDINHPDLAGNIWINSGEIPGNGVDDDGNGFIDDVNGWDFVHNDNTVFDYVLPTYPPQQGYLQDVDDHGTHVAGIIGAIGNNGIGISGVNWQTSLLPLKFLGPGGGTTGNLLNALAYAKTMRDRWVTSGGTAGANICVLNNSYGGNRPSQAERDAISALASSGILFVVASGNDATDSDRIPRYPANYELPNIIAVASTTTQDRFGFNFTNFGALSVHVGAPGYNILSTTPRNTYTLATGTSMATPHVSGIAALVSAANPGITMERLRNTILYGGDIAQDLPGRSVTGRRVNALRALQSAAETDTTPPGPVGNFQIQSQNGRDLMLQFTAPGDDANNGQASVYQVRYSDADIVTETQFDQARSLPVPVQPLTAGTLQSFTVAIPYQHTNGFVAIRTVDNLGNAGPISKVSVSVSQAVADPYLVSESSSTQLSTGGTLIFRGDDDYRLTVIPFGFKFFGREYTTLLVSLNGGLYFSGDFSVPSGFDKDAASSVYCLNGMNMIAGLWDDLRTDRRAGDGVYFVQPDQNRVIYRWEGVTRNGELPVAFEIELQRNGTIQIRYGDGNTGIFPVVGISGGARDAYLSLSHTSETTPADLGHANDVTFRLRNPATADLQVQVEGLPIPVSQGTQLIYTITARNLGPNETTALQVDDVLPAGTTFVSCTEAGGNQFGTCTGPPVGTSGIVSLRLGAIGAPFAGSDPFARYAVAVMVNAPAGTNLRNRITASAYDSDPNLSNNTAILDIEVIDDAGLSNVASISAGYSFSLARLTDGTVVSWGTNQQGQLGDDSTSPKLRPVQVTGLTHVIAVSAGYNHSMALTGDGSVWTWGANNFGQLGNNNSSVLNSLVPIKVPGLTGVTSIAAGPENSFAVKSDGSVWAWGSNDYGRLGGAVSLSKVYDPRRITAVSNVVAMAPAGTHVLALKSDGTLWGWGENDDGCLSPNNVFQYFSPFQLTGIDSVVGIAARSRLSVALRSNGTVWIWGYGYNGEFGDGTTGGRGTPGPANISDVRAISLGNAQPYAIKNDNSLWGWGFNGQGTLGDGTSSNRSSPVPISNLAPVEAIGGGMANVNLALVNGSVRSWGLNSSGELGDGSQIPRMAPGRVSGLITTAQPTLSIAPGTYNTIQNVIVSCASVGAVIHYTTNGQDPTENDPIVHSESALRLDNNSTVKVKAWRIGWIPSVVKTGVYNINAIANVIDDARNFVKQHYLDFLNRNPDAGGWDYWTTTIMSCGIDASCIHEHRIGVSAAFFIELEFQQTGYVVYRFYRAAYGTRVNAPTRANITFAQFLADRAQLVGGAGLAENTINLANSFVARPEFKTEYPDSMTNVQFVNKLFDTAGLTPYPAERQQQIDTMNNSGKTRAQVLLDVIEINEFKTREYNPAFVMMQYFGYLRRNPDQGGYDFWLNVLSNQPDNYRGMVCSFLTSTEYQERFGTTVTRSNQDCTR
jgi:uncharacterized repeat protein (TIGR01451 family)